MISFPARRERAARPFTRVEDLRRAAEKTYLAEEENLLARIEAARARTVRTRRGQLGDARLLKAIAPNWCQRVKLCAPYSVICAVISMR